ncbi:regulator of hypoxia-inducible factor 1-like [Brevipalpus obovatus]|uniref:regulator of hypoxia-inducible factor 1-like n=1 Tax=Brevipalpus obovatus TaxID=246614 RepID=UPI003D9E91DA
MKFVESGLWLVILIISQSRSGNSLLDGFFNQILPSIPDANFTQSFYLTSRISLLSLNSSLQNNTSDTILRLPTFHGPTNKSNNVSDSLESLCLLHLQYIIRKLWTNKRDTSLLSFIDSFAKPVPSVRNGNVNWHGNQMQCESTNVPFELESKPSSNFGGKYCRAEWSTDIGSDQSFKHYTGICVPSTCTREDFEYMKAFLEEFFFLKISEGSQVTEISCTGDNKIRIDSIIFYLICLSVIFLGILSTIYDRRREKTSERKQKGLKLSIFSIFSIPRNWKSLDGQKVSKNDILIIHYIRGISAVLVVLFHVGGGLMSIFIPGSISLMALVELSGVFWLLPRSVMTIFFFLTGLLIHRDYSNPDQKFNPFKSILKAFLRMSPSYYFVIFVQTSYISLIGLGPKHDYAGPLLNKNRCSQVFWNSLLYIQNFSSMTESCVFVSWSLAATLQLYIVSVFVVWILMRLSFVGLILVVFSMIWGFFITFKTLHDANLGHLFGLEQNSISVNFFKEYLRDLQSYIDEIYTQTAMWLSPFMMGILFAYVLPKIQQISHPQKKKSVVITFFLIIAFYTIFCSILCLKQNDLTYPALQTVAPVGITLILSLLIFIFHPESRLIGYKLTSKTAPFLVHLSRISYPLYLIHYSILVMILNGTSLTPTLDMFSMLCIIFGSFFTVYIASILLYLFIEAPIQNIRKIMNI